MIFLNKHGAAGEIVMGFGYLLLLFFVAVGVVGGVLTFFGSGIDFRGIESAQLASQIRTCIGSHTLTVGNTLELDQLSKTCRIKQQVVLDAYVLSLWKNGVQVLNVGDTVACDFKGAEKNIYYPRCREEKFTFEGARYVVRVGSHQITRLEAT